MSFSFTVKEFILGNGAGTPQFQFYKRGFNLRGNGSTPEWQDIILKGTTALTLVNAKAGSLEYLKLFGDTEQLPEQYIDTVTLSGGCEQRNLPSGFTQVEYLESSGTQYIDPDVTGSTRWVITAQASEVKGSSQALLSSTVGAAGGTWYGEFTTTGVWDVVSGGTNIPVTTKTTADLTFDSEGVRGTIGGVSVTRSASVTQGKWVILCSRFAEQYSFFFSGKLFDAKAYQNGVLVRNLIPCRRNSDSVLGMFDLVSQTFFTNAGTGSFTAGADVVVPSPTIPIDIVCNNGTIKVSPNLFDKNNLPERINAYFASSGTYWVYTVVGYSLRFPCLPNTTYTARYNGSNEQAVLSFASTNNDNMPTSEATSITVTQAIRQNNPTINTPITITTGANDKWLIVQYNAADPQNTDMANNLQIELGSTATTYMPYGQIYAQGTVEAVTDSNGLTANAERLLAVGTYKDTQEVLSGSVTRNVGIKVLDGTENWNYDAVYSRFFTSIADMYTGSTVRTLVMLSTHYLCISDGRPITQVPDNSFYSAADKNAYFKTANYTSASAWKQFLTSQYNAGTPVIIVYPLATATSEAVAGQFLSKSPATQTAGSISNLPIAITESQKTVPTPTQPLPINCNNGVLGIDSQGNITVTGTTETVLVHGKNLFDKNNIAYNNSTILADGSIISAENISVLDYIPVQPNATYTYSSTTISARAYNKRIVCFDANKNYITSIADTTGNPSGQFSITGTTPANTRYVMVACSNDQMATAQLELGSTATAYEPYTVLGTATAENLFKVGDYQDVQSVIDGGVIHNVGIKVFDGSENFDTSNAIFTYAVIDRVASKTPLICSHFEYSTKTSLQVEDLKIISFSSTNIGFRYDACADTTAFKAWLKSQYDNGTPVIVVYPKSTATTETVTAQPMNIQAGTNIVQIAQGSMDGLELEVKYKAPV